MYIIIIYKKYSVEKSLTRNTHNENLQELIQSTFCF